MRPLSLEAVSGVGLKTESRAQTRRWKPEGFEHFVQKSFNHYCFHSSLSSCNYARSRSRSFSARSCLALSLLLVHRFSVAGLVGSRTQGSDWSVLPRFDPVC
jgi:hypothetical protein